MEDKCIICGSVIPEGRQVCIACEKRNTSKVCPCNGCERSGCGAYHDKCERFLEWKKWLDDVNKWLNGKKAPRSKHAETAYRERLMRRARGYDRKGGMRDE